MSIQNKPDYKVFASGAKSGEIDTFPDILRGWGVTIDRTGEIPPMEWFNAIGKRVDEWLLYLTQRGIPEWDSSLDYPKSAVVTHGDVIYISLRASKGEQPNTAQAAWSQLGAFLGLVNYATNEALNNGLALKLDKSAVVQTTGQSTTDVMSQKAVTESFVQDIRLGSDTTLHKVSSTNVFTCPAGSVLTVVDVGDEPNVTAVCRPIQKLINGTWYTVSQL